MTFANFWLSRAAFASMFVFIYLAVKIYVLDSESTENRLAVLFNLVFAAWAGAASFWYAAEKPAEALACYRSFSWCWSVFPPLALHFGLRLVGWPGKRRPWLWRIELLAIYAPAVVLVIGVPIAVLAEPVYRGGYWMLTVTPVPLYFFFTAHYFFYILGFVVIVFRAASRAAEPGERARLWLIGATALAAVILGFVTDTVFLYLGIDFPNMAIFWILILSTGMFQAMRRYRFLSPLRMAEAPRVLNALTEFVIVLDEFGHVDWANDAALAALGKDRIQAASGLEPSAFLDRIDADAVIEVVAGTEATYGRRTHLGPERIPVELRAHRVMSFNQARGAVLTAADLRAEKALDTAKDHLADTGQRMEEFIAHSLDGIVLTDVRGYVASWNSPMAAITGIPAKDAVGRPIWEVQASLVPEDKRRPGDVDRLKTLVETALAGSAAPWNQGVTEQNIVRTDGTRRILQSTSFLIPQRDAPVIAAIGRDVTEERRIAEETIERIRKLDHAQKMDAIGALTSGIAHDFNNTLAGIVGALSLIRYGIQEGSYRSPADMERELDIMEKSAERAVSSVKRLLSLTKKRPTENKPFQLDAAIRRVVEFASRSFDPSVTVAIGDMPADAWVQGDPGQAEQLLLNLLINAEHAMTIMRPRGEKRGGAITVSLAPLVPDGDFLASNPEATNRPYWTLTVADEGIGIPLHVLPRIFDPFFTTKPLDKSSGLGLAMVHSIARQHGGWIDVESPPGRGATFRIYLPAGEAAPPADVDAAPTRGTGIVLVVDDDEVPRETARVMLGALGYATEPAASGEEALELFTLEPAKWSVVLMDIRMPGIDGVEAAARMRAVRPDLAIVFASGYAADESLEAMPADDDVVLIDKPYSLAELGKGMARALGNAGGL